MEEKPKKKLGRPRKKIIIPFELDESMSPQVADEQRKIAIAKRDFFKAKQEELKVLAMERKLISTKEVINITSNVFSKLKTMLYSSSNKLPAQIIGKDHGEVSIILFQFIDEILDNVVKDFDKQLNSIKIDEDDLEMTTSEEEEPDE